MLEGLAGGLPGEGERAVACVGCGRLVAEQDLVFLPAVGRGLLEGLGLAPGEGVVGLGARDSPAEVVLVLVLALLE